ncbi:hypothetical protein QQX98_001047 [Neonectria punicea]|uniref:Uncharacterized protein n=1 Tax=Neonectria punicea TaxID=979145 RepID=A0ABR1HRY6_9HYPO
MENPDLQSSAERDMSFEPVVPDLEAGVNQMLQTPWDKIYAVSKNGKTYIGPSALGGVPVDKIDETGPYWDQSWQSLEEFLAREPVEEELKENYHERLRRLPGDKALAAKAKFHMDNVSKHRKVREIFGNGSPYHPNQLASKHHIPHGGLCHKEIMYKLACKRIVRKAQALVGASWESTRDVIKTVIYRICDDSGNEQAQKYEDRLLRMAVLRSAQYRDKLANYGSKNVTKPSFSTKKPIALSNLFAMNNHVMNSLALQASFSGNDERDLPVRLGTPASMDSDKSKGSEPLDRNRVPTNGRQGIPLIILVHQPPSLSIFLTDELFGMG